MMRRNPGFTVVALLSLALGIGANSAIFSLVNSLILRTLPVGHPDQLVELLHRYPAEPHLNGFSWQAYQLIRDQNHVLSGLTASVYQTFHVRSEGLGPHMVQGGYVNGGFFPVLGIKPELGRLINPDDDHGGDASAVAVVSWTYWKNRLNQDLKIVGTQITVDDVTVTIVGVAPREFFGLQVEARQDIWLPLAMEPTSVRSSPRLGELWLVGRLNPGVSREQAQSELAVLYHSTLDEQAKATNNPFIRKMNFELEPAGAGISSLREEWAKPLLLLMVVVGLLLLIACTNLASLLLVRGIAREHEMALRVSLGAGRFRLARQVLTESLFLSVMGGVLGVLLAYFGATALVRIIVTERRPGPPIEFHAGLDLRVLTFTALVALLTGLLFGLFPAIRAMRSAPASSLRDRGSTGETRWRRFLGKSFVVAQVALSMVLLSAATLLVRHLLDLQDTNLGFERDHVLLVSLDASGSGYNSEQLSAAYQELLQHLEAVPGVRSATICAASPISGAGANRGVNVEGYQASPGEIRNVMENWVAPKYFETLGTPLLAGRDFIFEDWGHPKVAIINQTMARYYFGKRNPVGMHVSFDGDDSPYEIVGVAGDSKYLDIREVTYRTVYLNAFQEPRPPSQFALRTRSNPEDVTPDVRRAVHDLLPTVSVGRTIALAEQVKGSIVPERLTAVLSGWFGALGLVLTAVGLYGLLAYTVARRTNEIGIRMALGASRGDVAKIVLTDALGMVLVGLLIGIPISFSARASRRVGCKSFPHRAQFQSFLALR